MKQVVEELKQLVGGAVETTGNRPANQAGFPKSGPGYVLGQTGRFPPNNRQKQRHAPLHHRRQAPGSGSPWRAISRTFNSPVAVLHGING